MTEPLLRRLAKVVIFCALFAVGVAGFFLGNPGQKARGVEDEFCRAKCTNLNKFHRLVPASGRNDGPWICECY